MGGRGGLGGAPGGHRGGRFPGGGLCGFRDCLGFLNSTGRLRPKKCCEARQKCNMDGQAIIAQRNSDTSPTGAGTMVFEWHTVMGAECAMNIVFRGDSVKVA